MVGDIPASYDQDVADLICERLAGGMSLRSICKSDDTPAMSTVFKWLSLVPSFAEQYARAREAQADAIFDEIIDIADDGSNDWMERRREDGSVDELVNHEHIQRSKLRIDARRWMAGKMRPKVYGEKILHAGHDGGSIKTESQVDVVDLAQRLREAAALRPVEEATPEPLDDKPAVEGDTRRGKARGPVKAVEPGSALIETRGLIKP